MAFTIEEYNKAIQLVSSNKSKYERVIYDMVFNMLLNYFQIILDTDISLDININGRLKRAGARVRAKVYGNKAEPYALEVSSMAIANAIITGSKEELNGILLHECIHVALAYRGEPYEDSDIHFIETCKSVGAPLKHSLKSPKHRYVCDNGHYIHRARRFNENNYSCSCGSSLSYKGQVIN